MWGLHLRVESVSQAAIIDDVPGLVGQTCPDCLYVLRDGERLVPPAVLLIATEDAARTVGKGIWPPGLSPIPAAEQSDVKDLNDWLLPTLWCLLLGEPPADSQIDSLTAEAEFEFVYEESEGGPWICRVPHKLVEQLFISIAA